VNATGCLNIESMIHIEHFYDNGYFVINNIIGASFVHNSENKATWPIQFEMVGDVSGAYESCMRHGEHTEKIHCSLHLCANWPNVHSNAQV
jgi:hypothetical protein